MHPAAIVVSFFACKAMLGAHVVIISSNLRNFSDC